MNNSDLSELSGFEEIEHTADRAYRVWGKSLEDLFLQAALGLYQLAGTQLTSDKRVKREIRLEGIDTESLLVTWLNELLHLYESEHLASERLEIIELDGKILHARITAAKVLQWLEDIKAVTYHNLAILSTETGFEATIVLDV